jgi:peptidoglycan/xylan/chitin deacetylase (PgdA/CDA1 family)
MTRLADHMVSDRVPILVYHSISNDPHPYIQDFNVTPTTLGRHLDLIQEFGLTPLTVSRFVALREDGHLPAKPVLITFDDGWRDVTTVALPMLHHRAMPATLYVTTGFLRGRAAASRIAAPPNAALHWDDLAHLADGGFEIGAHTVSHPELDVVRRAQARNEIADSRRDLEQHLSRPVVSFAYPHGYHDRKVCAMVADAGFTSACVVKNAFATRMDDPLSLARILVRSDTSLETMQQWLHGEGAPVAGPHELLRTRMWRTYRRGRAVLVPTAKSYGAKSYGAKTL